MAPVFGPDMISIIVFLLGVATAILILLYIAISSEDEEEQST